MKTEEIRLGDILYDEERKMLVKRARVDEDGVVKYSAYTDMQRIFKTVPPPYRVGTRTDDASIPATDEQCKYMKRELAVCEYVNLPKDNRMSPLRPTYLTGSGADKREEGKLIPLHIFLINGFIE